MITKLTSQQQAAITSYVEQYLSIGVSTVRCDRAEAEAAVAASYAYLKLPPPRFVWADSPFSGRVLAAQLAAGSEDVTEAQIAAQAAQASYGSFEAYWVSFYAFVCEQLPVKKDELIDIVKRIVQNCGVYWTFEDVVIMTDKPTGIHFSNKKLHNEHGLALEYSDGSGLYAVRGIVYPSMMHAAIAAVKN